jgi:hypothetical protein
MGLYYVPQETGSMSSLPSNTRYQAQRPGTQPEPGPANDSEAADALLTGILRAVSPAFAECHQLAADAAALVAGDSSRQLFPRISTGAPACPHGLDMAAMAGLLPPNRSMPDISGTSSLSFAA